MTTKAIMRCQNEGCEGQLYRDGDEVKCRLCSHPHTENGELIPRKRATKKTTIIEVKYSGEAYGINHRI